VRVLVIDDQPVVEAGITFWLNNQAERINKAVEVDYARGSEEAIRVENSDTYDLVLLDYHMPGGLEGIEALRAVKETFSASAVVMYSGEDNREKILETIDHGACGFLPKSFDKEEVISAIECVLKTGGLYLPPQALGGVRAYRSNLSPPDQRERDRILDALSDQQKRVLKRWVQGMKRDQIAKEISKSVSTVKTHLARAYEVLGVNDRTEAVKIAITLKLFLSD
jgi:DNA-binding NarL/FixJ family response regulator